MCYCSAKNKGLTSNTFESSELLLLSAEGVFVSFLQSNKENSTGDVHIEKLSTKASERMIL